MATRPRPDLDFEPQLNDMLDDPVVQAMMTRDGVERDEILELVSSVQEKLGPVTEA